MDTNREILNNLIAINFFTIDNFIMEDNEELQKEFKTNCHIELKSTNWEEYKETFYNQRFDKYKNEGLPKDMIIEEELEFVESLPNENKKYKRLKRLYTRYLKALSSQPREEEINSDNSKADLASKVKNNAISDLKKIWLPEPKISVEDFIQKGIEKGLWNDSFEIITAKNSIYATGKTMLASIFIAFKGWAISSNIDSNKVGTVFCDVFNINIKETTKEPYKAFSSGNRKTIAEIKRTFGI